MSIVFNESLNNFARRYFIKGNEQVGDDRLFPRKYESVINSICEQLLIHDGISFKVYGENIPLTILINTFGVRATEELLEQGALKFVLWNPGVTYMVDDIPGILPLQSMGSFTTDVHSDPEESIMSGLEFMRNPLPRKMRRDITRKVLKHYVVPPEELARDAAEFGHEGYKNNLFKEFGLSNEKTLTDLKQEERKQLCNLATQCLDLTLLAKYQYSTYNSFDLMNLNRSEFQNLKDAKAVENVVDTVFNIEEVPNFSEMISQKTIDIKSIPKLRSKKSSEKFRAWVDKVSHHEESSDITREYIDAIVDSKTANQTPRGKLTRVLGVVSLGAIVGSTVPGPSGIITGAAIGLLDSYVLDKIVKGWTPRHYIDKEIKPLINN
ncbi:hypothetical protein [Sporosarcina beigongshangi]|uniref:hypothetical protein n=1 Tax=Sporosarcina beigongshangi TaxID=2782538 RepID=UPI00193A558B|nr:hypothetical protein [Sporosarcina beigongshangi]